jgi:hypothetical protein
VSRKAVLILLAIAVAVAAVDVAVNVLSSRTRDLPWRSRAALTSDAKAGLIAHADADRDTQVVTVTLSTGGQYRARYRDAGDLSGVLGEVPLSETSDGRPYGVWSVLAGFACLTLFFWFVLYVFAYHDAWPFRRFAVFAR